MAIREAQSDGNERLIQSAASKVYRGGASRMEVSWRGNGFILARDCSVKQEQERGFGWGVLHGLSLFGSVD